MRRAAVFGRADEWFAVRDRSGLWVVVDASGRQPLASPDPLERMFACHLAAQGPALRVALAEMARRWESVLSMYGHDAQLLQFAEGTLALSFPSPSTQAAAGAFSSQPVQLELAEQEEIARVPERDRVLRVSRATARRLAL